MSLSVGCQVLFLLLGVTWPIFGELDDKSLSENAAVVTLENAWMRLEFSRESGAVTRLQNKVCGVELIHLPTTVEPWKIQTPDKILSQYNKCQVEERPNGVSIKWELDADLEVHADWSLDQGVNQALVTSKVINRGTGVVLSLSYPVLHGIGPLAVNGERDRLLHSQLMGSIFNDPFHLFQHDHPLPLGKGIVASRYPNGFHGSTLQMLAYYAQSKGGFYIATEDAQLTDKEFNFFKEDSQRLCCEIKHFQWNAVPGASLELDYSTVVRCLTEGNWYEPAELYRSWGEKQPWCQRGTLHERLEQGDASSWLVLETGIAGMWWPFDKDIREPIRRLKEIFNTRALHLELFWTDQPSVRQARDSGGRFGPFYFPHLAQRNKSGIPEFDSNRIEPLATVVDPNWVAMCPVVDPFRQSFVDSANEMVESKERKTHQIWMDANTVGCKADALYFDIGPCAGIPTHCYAKNHKHEPGAGRGITNAHRRLLVDCQKGSSRLAEKYIPVGTECISEPFLDSLDFYYARTTGLGLDMEQFPWVRELTWLPDGQMEIVPLFQFVYHGYSPLAIQGVYSHDPWSAPASQDYCTWSEARSYLWGGIVTTMPPSESTVTLKRLRFLKSLTTARTSFASDYLAKGTRMLRPPNIDCSPIEISHGLQEAGWLRQLRYPSTVETQSTDAVKESKELSVDAWVTSMLKTSATPAKSSTLQTPQVLTSAYLSADGKLGILLVNLSDDNLKQVTIDLEPLGSAWLGQCVGAIKSLQVERELGEFTKEIQIDIPAQELILLEIVTQR